MAKTSIYSKWDNTKTVEYTIIAERMLRKFNPYHKDNKVQCAEFRYILGKYETIPENEQEVQSTDWMFDQYQYQQWLKENNND